MSPVVVVDEQDDPLPAPGLGDLAAAALAAEGVPDGALLTLHLVGRARSAELHTAHLGRTGATDVLSFPIEDLRPGEPPAAPSGGPPLVLGDVVICPAVVAERAARDGVAFDAHMAQMVVHGILHVLGYDHQDDADGDIMEARERALLALAAATGS